MTSPPGAALHGDPLRAAITGDDAALVALVRSTRAELRRFGRAVCRDAADAEDAVQDAFLQLALRPELQRAPGVVGWLLTTVKHQCLRFLRRVGVLRRRFGSPVDPAEQRSSEPTPEQRLESYRVAELVQLAIGELAAPEREILLLRDIEGLTGEEVCAALALSEPAMKSRLHRARAELREALRRRAISAK